MALGKGEEAPLLKKFVDRADYGVGVVVASPLGAGVETVGTDGVVTGLGMTRFASTGFVAGFDSLGACFVADASSLRVGALAASRSGSAARGFSTGVEPINAGSLFPAAGRAAAGVAEGSAEAPPIGAPTGAAGAAGVPRCNVSSRSRPRLLTVE
jgi:hypothetical protein